MVAADDLSSDFLHHTACPCGASSDAYGVYSDGHGYCFSCGKYVPGEGEAVAAPPKETNRVSGLIDTGSPQAISSRHLTEESCRRFGYTVSKFGDDWVQVANYRDPDSGEAVAQKLRWKNKDFKFLGDTKRAGLYGMHLWRDGGKRVIVTEGEIDAISVSQALNHRWPVVSIPNGAQGAKASVTKNLDWLSKFEHVDLCFDMDEAGRAAVDAVCGVFPPGKVRTIRLPLKDANEMLVAGRAAELVECLWAPKAHRPDGIVTVSELADEVMKEAVVGLPWWDERLTKATHGRRFGEVYALGAGTGIGKSDWLSQQIAFDLLTVREKVALFAFEQQPVESVRRIAGKVAGRRFHIPGAGWTSHMPGMGWTGDELKAAVAKLGAAPGLFLYDHFGSCDWDEVVQRIRYLRHNDGVRIFYIDHLTALAAEADDERVALEKMMASVGKLVKELDAIVMFVSHLSTPEGRPHEEGGRVMIRHFKGSRAIGFWCHYMFGLERNQQAENEDERQTTTLGPQGSVHRAGHGPDHSLWL